MVSARAVDDDVGRGLGILCRNAEFAGVVVAGAGRDDAERYVGLREHLQCERDDAVTADDDERVHAAFERALDEPPGVLGVGARDGDDVDAAAMELRDRPLGGVRCAAVSRRRIGQDGDPADGHGISLPGLRIPVGIEHRLDRAQHLDAEIADLVAHPRPVVGADGVVVGDRRAACGPSRRTRRSWPCATARSGCPAARRRR